MRPWLGWILIAAGAVLMLFGYLGVSREALPGKQIPYLVSGGIGGMLVAVLGAYFLATQELRRDSGPPRPPRGHGRGAAHGALLRRPDAPDLTAVEPRRPTAPAGPSRSRPARGASWPSRAASSSTGPAARWSAARRRPRSRWPRPASRGCGRAPPAPRPRPRWADRRMFYVQIALLGVIFGCFYALSATGIVLTYTATGVFNIAHFAIALLAGLPRLAAERAVGPPAGRW